MDRCGGGPAPPRDLTSSGGSFDFGPCVEGVIVEAVPHESQAGHRPNQRAATCPQSQQENEPEVFIGTTLAVGYDI